MFRLLNAAKVLVGGKVASTIMTSTAVPERLPSFSIRTTHGLDTIGAEFALSNKTQAAVPSRTSGRESSHVFPAMTGWSLMTMLNPRPA